MEQFIDHLWDDKKTLMTCALVCLAWVPRSRYYLFKEITFGKPESDPDSHRQFIEILAHRLCSFALSVRGLTIIPTGLCPQDGTSGAAATQLALVKSLASHACKLGSVKSIYWSLLDELTMPCFGAFVFQPFPGFCSGITLLQIDVGYFESKDWMTLIPSFRSLRHLFLVQKNKNIDWERHVAQLVLPMGMDIARTWPSPRLIMLTVHSLERSAILPFFQRIYQWLYIMQIRIPFIQFRSVCLSSVDNDMACAAITPFVQYLRFLGPSLKGLVLQFYNYTSIGMFLLLFSSGIFVNIGIQLVF